jgi:eukaryotic-like serine/threonine-protein kinase
MSKEPLDVKLIFCNALEKESDQERQAYLDEVCTDNPELRTKLEELLALHDQADGFLEVPAPEVTLDGSPLLEGPGTIIGAYKLLEKIGEGGMAVVYMAKQTQPLQRRVALKIIKLGMDTKEVIARFEAERQALAVMDHPNIAKVFDAGATDTGRPFFVMELVRGVSISEFCDKNQLNTRERLELFICVCQAVHHAHQKGIIHRDLKPSNIMVTLHDGEAVVKVIDFGIAKAVNQELTEKTIFTRYAQMIGTPEYMSPEQAEMSGLDVDTRTDVFSLGVLLYELLTGSTPFDSEYLLSKGYGELQRIIREEEPVRPSTRISTLGETATDIAQHRRTSPELLCKLIRTDLDWIVMKTLEKNRKRRYESVSEFAADIKRHLNHEPVQAGRPSTVYKVQKFIKRNRVLVASCAAIVVILVWAVIISTQQAWVAEKARRAERNARTSAEQERDRAKQARRDESAARAVAEQERDRTKQAEQQAQQEKHAAQHNAYASKMLLARLNWENGNIYRLQKTLTETGNHPDRGFEWYYWQRMCRLELMVLHAHDGPVLRVIYSPDGQSIASSSGNSVHIWDARTGTEFMTYEGHKAAVYGLAYSPDGKRLVTGSRDRTARIWDTKTGKQLKLLQGHTGDILCVDFSADGQLIATGSKDETIRVWDAATGNIKSCLRHTCVRPTSVVFSPDGQRLASSGLTTRSSGGDAVKIWDLSTEKAILALNENAHLTQHVEYLPDGQRLVHAGYDGRVGIWDAVYGKLIRAYKGHKNTVNFASVSPDGKRIVSGSVTGTIKTWDSDSGKDLITFKGHTGSVTHAEFSPDGERIVSGSEDGSIRIWNAMDDPSVLVLPYPERTLVTSISFSPNSRWLAAGDRSKDVKIWDVVDGKLVQTLSGHEARILSVAFSPDGKRIATSSNDGAVKIWDPFSGHILLTVSEQSDSANLVVYTPDSQRLIGGGSDGIINIWDSETGQLTLTIAAHAKKINDIAISPDGRAIGSISEDGTIKLWDSSTGHEIYTREGHDTHGVSIAFSPDGERFATGGDPSDTLKVWNVANGQELFSVTGGVRQGIAFSPDGKRLAHASDPRGKLHIIDATSGEDFLVVNRIGVHITDIAFSPDGKRIASCGFDGKVSIYQGASEDDVEDWRDEQSLVEKKQAKRKARDQKEAERQTLARLSDEGAIKSWLILGSIPVDKDAGLVFGEQLIADEAKLHPSAGGISLVGGDEYVWNEACFDDAIIDFTTNIERYSGNKISYAVCYIKMSATKKGVLMKTNAPGWPNARVYLNSELVCELSGGLGRIANVAALTLNAGINVVVLKSFYNTDGGRVSLWFVDGDGSPLEGLTVTLDPNDVAGDQ